MGTFRSESKIRMSRKTKKITKEKERYSQNNKRQLQESVDDGTAEFCLSARAQTTGKKKAQSHLWPLAAAVPPLCVVFFSLIIATKQKRK